MELVREKMRWLFSAEFADRSSINQTQKDLCSSRDDGTGSTFTDVLAYPSRLVAFHLLNEESTEITSVDLITGAFIVNGTPIHIHDQYFEPLEHELTLVYFREVRVDQLLGDTGEKISDRHFTNRYFIGWETEGKQVTLAVG